MMLLDKNAERLRAKHVRTLELLQKTLDENAVLRRRLGDTSGVDAIGPSSGSQSNRSNELEDEINRLRADQSAKLLASEETARLRHDELTRTIATLQEQQGKLQTDTQTLATRLQIARETLQTERKAWDQERRALQSNNETLQRDVQQHLARVSTLEHELAQQRQQHQCELEARVHELQAELTRQGHDLKAHSTQNEALRLELAVAKDTSTAMGHELVQFRDRNCELQAKLSQLQLASDPMSISPKKAAQLREQHQQLQQQWQRQQQSYQQHVQALEAENARLMGENRTLHEAMTKLQAQLAELVTRQSQVSNNQGGGGSFAAHVDLKRENVHLRAQVEEMKQLQRRYLSSGKKKSIHFPAL